jgi:hypothetical protein
MKRFFCCMFLLGCASVWAGPLVFDATVKDAHLTPAEQSVTTDFHFENQSDKVAVIQRYDASCSCMKVTIQGGKLRYLPGEKGTIRTLFDMGNFSGVVDKSVTVYVDDDPEDSPSLVLTTRVHIPVLVSLEPKTVHWTVGEEAKEKIIRVTMNHTEPIHILRMTGTADRIRSELRTIEKGKTYEIALQPTDTKTPLLGILRMETDCSLERHRVQQAFAVIRRQSPE